MSELNAVLEYIRKNPNKSDMKEIKRGMKKLMKKLFFHKKIL